MNKFLANIVSSVVFNKKKRKQVREILLKKSKKDDLAELSQTAKEINAAIWRLLTIAEDPLLTRRLEFFPKYMREKQAAAETLDYITVHAPQAMLLQDRFDVLNYVFANCLDENLCRLGLFLEFGVFKGDTINFYSALKNDKIFYGFDSFEGLPEDWAGWSVLKDKFNLNNKLPKVNENVELVKGWFNETLPGFLKEHKEKIAFVHVDCDIYSSTKCIFDNLEKRIVPGTIIVFDEYFNYPNWKEHEHKAFQEFVQRNDVKYEPLAIGYFQFAVRILAVKN